MKSYDRLFIGGEWVSSAGTGTIDVINPTTEEVMGRVPDSTTADIDRAVAAARVAFDEGPWPRMTPAERAAIMTKEMCIRDSVMAEPNAQLATDLFGDAWAPSVSTDSVTVAVVGWIPDRARLEQVLDGWQAAMGEANSVAWLSERLRQQSVPRQQPG